MIKKNLESIGVYGVYPMGTPLPTLYLYFVCCKALRVYYYALKSHISHCIIILLYVHFVFTTINDGNNGKAILLIELPLLSVTKGKKPQDLVGEDRNRNRV